MTEETIDDPAAPFFEAASRGVLMIHACNACGTPLGLDVHFCSECLSEDLRWQEASGRGTLFTFGVMHQKMPGFEDRVPYPVAVVELEEGPRIYSTVVDCATDELAAGMPLIVTFEGEQPIPKFRPA